MRQKTHTITITARFDAPLTAKEARYAVWNSIQYLEMFGEGKQSKRDEMAWGRNREPYGVGKFSVRR
jgi:hypothetical protein